MDLDMYTDLDEVVLREKLTSCKDISERCRIRAAIRRMSNASIEEAARKAKISRERRNVEPLEDRVNKLMEEEAKEREKKLEKLDEKIKGITDEDELRSLLKETDDYYERKRIRTAVRELRRAKDAEIEAYRPTRRASRQQQHDLLENGLNVANAVKDPHTNHADDEANLHTDKSIHKIDTMHIMTDTDMIDVCQSINDVRKSEQQDGQKNDTKLKEVPKICEDSMTDNTITDEQVSEKCIRLDIGVNDKNPEDEKIPNDNQEGINVGHIDQQPIDSLNKTVNDDPTGHQIEAGVNGSDGHISDYEISVQPTSDESQVEVIDDSNDLVPSGHTCEENMDLLPDTEDDTQVLKTLPVLGSIETVRRVEEEHEDDADRLTETDKQGEDKLSEIDNVDEENVMRMNKEQKSIELNNEKDEEDDEIGEDIFAIQDENVLREKLRETDDIEKKRQIRAAMRELRRKIREKSQNEDEQIDMTTHSASLTSNDAVSSTNQDTEVESHDQELTTIQIAFEVPETGQHDEEAVTCHDANIQDVVGPKQPDIAENVEDNTDINHLQRLLDDCEDPDERRRLRTAIRLLRRHLREEQECIEAKRDEDVAMVAPDGCQDEITADGEEILESEAELDEAKIEGCQTIQIEFEVPQGDDEDEVEEQTPVYPIQFAAFEKAVEGMTSLLQKGLPTQSLITEGESHIDDCDEDIEEEEEEEDGDDEDEEVEDLLVPTVEETQLAIVEPIIKEQEIPKSDNTFESRSSELSVEYKDIIVTDPDNIKDRVNIDQSEVLVAPCTKVHTDISESEDDDDVRNDVVEPVDNGDDEVELTTTTSVEIAVNSSKNTLILQDDAIDSSVISLDFERIDGNVESLPVVDDDAYSTSEDQATTPEIAIESCESTPSEMDLQVGKEDTTKCLSKVELSCNTRIDAVTPIETSTSRNNSDHDDSSLTNEMKAITEPKRKMLSKKTLFLNDTNLASDKESTNSSRASSIAGSLASTPTSPHSSRSGSITSPNNKVMSMRNKFQFGGPATTTPHNATSKKDAKIIKGMAGKVSGAAAKFSLEVPTSKKNYSPSPLVIKTENMVSRFIQAKNHANNPSTLACKKPNESSQTSKSITGLVLSGTPKTGNVLERYKPVQSSIKKDTKQNKTETESLIKKTNCAVRKEESIQTPNTKRKSQLKVNLNSEMQSFPKTPTKLVTIEEPLSITKERPSYLEPISRDALNTKYESPLGMDNTTSILSISSSTDQNGNPMEIALELDIAELGNRKLTSKSETDKDQICDNNTCVNMAPDIEQMENVTELEKMLEVETVFEERKRIRSRLRELRKMNKDVIEQPTTDREKRRRERRQEMTIKNSQRTSTDDRNNNINEKESTTPKKALTTITTPSTPVDNKPPTPSTPVDNKPPLSPNNNSTAVTNKKSETKTPKIDKEEEKSSVTDDGKTKTTTKVKTTEKDGFQSVTKSSISKSVDGNTKSQTETTEQVVRQEGPCGFSYAKKATTVSSSSSSSSSSKVPEIHPMTSRKMSKFDEELAKKKREREEKRAEDAVKWKEQQASRNKRLQEQRRTDQQAAKNKKANIMQMFGGKVESGGGGSSSGPPRMMVQNANSIKAKLLEWCRRITQEYPTVKIENFSRSWNNGIAFCAIIHHFYPGAFNFDELNPKARRHNFDLAFKTAETLANIMPLLDTEDMIMMKDTPDWKCVFTYVQSLYRNLHDKPICPV